MHLQSHTQLFGKILKDLELSSKENNSLGELAICDTDDGTVTLYSHNYKESFHSNSGALKEATEKYINPAELYRFKKGKKIVLLDVCLGLGYNTGCFLEYFKKNELHVEWWGLELDKRPLKFAINNNAFNSCWSEDVLRIFHSINNNDNWNEHLGKGRILWGDARKKLQEIPNSKKFDIILLDAFSPQKCPHLWTSEFLNALSRKLALKGRLITYCTASAVRKSLKDSQLEVLSTVPIDRNSSLWSIGTVGIASDARTKLNLNSGLLRPLSRMEEEHLLTRAAIPYRDPNGTDDIKEIIKRRLKEQQKSLLESTSAWKNKWISAKSTFID